MAGAVGAMHSHVELFFEASGLPRLDVGSSTDAYAVLEVQQGGTWVRVARTETVRDSATPRWSAQIATDYQFEAVQNMRLVAWDDDSPGTADDLGRRPSRWAA